MTVCLCGYEIAPDDHTATSDEALGSVPIHADRQGCIRAHYREEGLLAVSDATVALHEADANVEAYRLLVRATGVVWDALHNNLPHAVRAQLVEAKNRLYTASEELLQELEK